MYDCAPHEIERVDPPKDAVAPAPRDKTVAVTAPASGDAVAAEVFSAALAPGVGPAEVLVGKQCGGCGGAKKGTLRCTRCLACWYCSKVKHALLA